MNFAKKSLSIMVRLMNTHAQHEIDYDFLKTLRRMVLSIANISVQTAIHANIKKTALLLHLEERYSVGYMKMFLKLCIMKH